MSLRDAKRLLHWNVVMEALAAADVGPEITAMVEAARQAGDVAQAMGAMLIGSADTKQTKNYVKVEMVGLVAPFERVYVELIRVDGKTSHERRVILADKLAAVRCYLAVGSPLDTLRLGMIEDLDKILAEEAS